MRYTQGQSESQFLADELVQDAVIRNLEIIGEAVTKLSPAFKQRNVDIPWRDISGMRNRLIHAYIYVNMAIVWATVVGVLPDLQLKISAVLRGTSS